VSDGNHHYQRCNRTSGRRNDISPHTTPSIHSTYHRALHIHILVGACLKRPTFGTV
jgi:hypothetical protein